jgi:tetratricopeptide (TPR) repeat protein
MPEMIPHDRYRSPDSFERLAGMERAVTPHLGRLTPQLAARILRDRSQARWANGSTVGNLLVLNAAIVHPASRTLWHSTAMQPHAAFGAYLPLRIGAGSAGATEIPADPMLGLPAAEREALASREARRAIRHSDQGELAEARAIWDRLAQAQGPLDPTRIAWESALVRWRADEILAAYQALAPLEAADAAFDARAHGLFARGVLADALGRRDEALRLYALAQAHLDTHPEYTFFDALRVRITEGRAAPLDARVLPTQEHWMNLWW